MLQQNNGKLNRKTPHKGAKSLADLHWSGWLVILRNNNKKKEERNTEKWGSKQSNHREDDEVTWFWFQVACFVFVFLRPTGGVQGTELLNAVGWNENEEGVPSRTLLHKQNTQWVHEYLRHVHTEEWEDSHTHSRLRTSSIDVVIEVFILSNLLLF